MPLCICLYLCHCEYEGILSIGSVVIWVYRSIYGCSGYWVGWVLRLGGIIVCVGIVGNVGICDYIGIVGFRWICVCKYCGYMCLHIWILWVR